ncbi:hypothetical protein D3C72_1262850 [compost metagenome]
MRQKGILLAFVETVYLIDKQNGATTGVTILSCPLNRLTDFFDARCHGGNSLDVRLAVAADQLRQRRFPGARRPP